MSPGFRVETIDSTGAGDAFNGALASAVAEGVPLTSAIERANAAGALATAGTWGAGVDADQR
jgi:ribokinase